MKIIGTALKNGDNWILECKIEYEADTFYDSQNDVLIERFPILNSKNCKEGIEYEAEIINDIAIISW